jgi:hypothetical protein
MAVSFNCTAEDERIIRQIAKRAIATIQFPLAWKTSRLDIKMDVTAVHANGCPLNLRKLLTFDDFNFAHDILGIRRHLNRDTGVFENCFRPRCALPEPDRRPARRRRAA